MKKKSKFDVVEITVSSAKFSRNFKPLVIDRNPEYDSPDEEFSETAYYDKKEYEYIFNNENPNIEDDGKDVTLYVSGVYVGAMKKEDADTYRNLVKSNRLHHYSVDVDGGNYRMLIRWTGKDGKERDIVSYSKRGYRATVKLFCIPAESNNEKSKEKISIIKRIKSIIS